MRFAEKFFVFASVNGHGGAGEFAAGFVIVAFAQGAGVGEHGVDDLWCFGGQQFFGQAK